MYGLSEEERRLLTDDRIESVSKSANIHHFISSLPHVSVELSPSLLPIILLSFLFTNFRAHNAFLLISGLRNISKTRDAEWDLNRVN